MVKNQAAKTNSAPYRVLDLSEDGCMIGGRLLADLGADVIKIERPGGSPSRIAPFYKDTPDPEKSLFWFAPTMRIKRGITLDITRTEGKDIFKKLARAADVVIESFAPGYMDSLTLGYNDLCKIRPDIIFAGITPFGQNGPKAGNQGSDLTVWAAAGTFISAVIRTLLRSGSPFRRPLFSAGPKPPSGP